jgi:hypothetical protein
LDEARMIAPTLPARMLLALEARLTQLVFWMLRFGVATVRYRSA